MLSGVFDYAVKQCKIEELYGVFEEGNVASEKIFINLGFEHFETKIIDNQEVHVFQYLNA